MIRKTILVDSDKIIIDLPEHYIGKTIEVIVFSKDEISHMGGLVNRDATLNTIAIDTKEYKFNREDANER